MGDNKTLIKSVETVSRSNWLLYCKNCTAATFFHTPWWSELFERCYPGKFKSASKIFSFKCGATALLPLVIKRRLFGLHRIVCSMPAGTFGGYLSSSPLSPENEMVVVQYLTSSSDLILRENPYNPIGVPLPEGSWYEDPTQIIDLQSGYEKIWKNATAGHRNAVRNAVRSGVVITEAVTVDEWKSYVTIYSESIARWKQGNLFSGVHYDEHFFLEVAKLEPPLRKLWIASVKGKPIAGILCFYWNKHAVVWHGAGLSDYFSHHPNNLLYDRALFHAAESGYRWFDTNPSGTLTGVYKFKQYLGAKPLRSRVIIRRSKISRLYQLLRNRQRGEQ